QVTLDPPKKPIAEGPAVFDQDDPQVAAVAAFLNGKNNAEIKLAGNLDLTTANTSGDPALVFQGDSLLIEPRDREHPTLRLDYLASGQKPRIGLLVKSGKVTLRNLRFEVDGRNSPGVALAALVRDGGEILVENCLFVQKQPPSGSGSLSSIK